MVHHGSTQCATKDVALMLCQLILANGFATDADIPGTEKLCVTMARPKWLITPLHDLTASDIGAKGDLLAPGCVFAVKGWSRSVCCLAILMAAFEDADLLEAGCAHQFLNGSLQASLASTPGFAQDCSGVAWHEHYYAWLGHCTRKHTYCLFNTETPSGLTAGRSLAVVHATIVEGDDMSVVSTNRGPPLLPFSPIISFWGKSLNPPPKKKKQVASLSGITLSASAIRRRPNAFNLVHQMMFLQRGGLSGEQTLQSLKVGIGLH